MKVDKEELLCEKNSLSLSSNGLLCRSNNKMVEKWKWFWMENVFSISRRRRSSRHLSMLCNYWRRTQAHDGIINCERRLCISNKLIIVACRMTTTRRRRAESGRNTASSGSRLGQEAGRPSPPPQNASPRKNGIQMPDWPRELSSLFGSTGSPPRCRKCSASSS